MNTTHEFKLLSIVIPTKDRYTYLFQLIRLLDGYNLDNIEVVIQDNSADNTEMLKFLNTKAWKDLKYSHTKEPIPIRENIDLAIKQVNAEYVCLIGDDDGVLPNIVDCVKWMKLNGIEALRPAVTVYNWPDYADFGNQKISGALMYDGFSFGSREVNSLKSLHELSNRGFRHIYTIPKVYQGIVKKQCLDKIFEIGGTYFPGASPDMANAVALSFVIDKFVMINMPVVLIGQSQNTGGGEKMLKSKVLDIDEVAFLPKDAKQNWDKHLPRVWCSQTVWPESATSAIRYMRKEGAVKVNYDFILAWFIQTHPDDKQLAYKLPHSFVRMKGYLFYFRFIDPFKVGLIKLLNRLRGKPLLIEGRTCIKRDLPTLKDAVDYLVFEYAEYLKFDKMQK